MGRRSEPPEIICEYLLLPGFAYRHGVRMIVDAEALSQEVIEAVTADFLGMRL